MTQPGSARSGDDLPSAYDSSAASSQREPGQESSRELLEQVVRRTLSDQDDGEPPAALALALREVAKRFQGQNPAWETVVVELVDQVLLHWFSAGTLAAEGRRLMAAEIGETLGDDPQAADRLRRLWNGLREAAG
jgi:hypothetical protein